jgi:hypothetical protein
MGVHLIDSALFGDQFSTAAMRRVFDDAAMVRSWMQVEAALARAEAAVGLIPRSAAETISTCVAETTWDPAALTEGIAATFHPLVPAIRLLAERCGEAGGYVPSLAPTPGWMQRWSRPPAFPLSSSGRVAAITPRSSGWR